MFRIGSDNSKGTEVIFFDGDITSGDPYDNTKDGLQTNVVDSGQSM